MWRRELQHVVSVVMFGAGVFLAVAFGIPEWKRWQYHDVRQALLDELQPVALSNCTLARVGSAHDGGYLMCANLIDGIQVAYSYGVGPNDEWGCAVSRQHRVPVHQYDCFDPARPVCDGGQFVFHNECIADQSRDDGCAGVRHVGEADGAERRHRAAQGRENRRRRR